MARSYILIHFVSKEKQTLKPANQLRSFFAKNEKNKMRTWVISMNVRSHCGLNRLQKELCEKKLTAKYISQGSTDNTSAVAKQHRCYHILKNRTESHWLKSLNAFGVWHQLWPKAEAQWQSLSAASSQNHLHNRQPTLSSNISSYKEPFNEFTGATFSNLQVWPFLCMFQ